MINRPRFLGSLGLGVLARPIGTDAQPAVRLPRVGLIGSAPSAYTEAVKQGLSELGYVENKTVVLDFRYSGGKAERFSEIAAALVTRGVDVLIASSEPATRAALQVTARITIVTLVADDPVTTGLVPSLSRPGGNRTGVSTFIPSRTAFAASSTGAIGQRRRALDCRLEGGRDLRVQRLDGRHA